MPFFSEIFLIIYSEKLFIITYVYLHITISIADKDRYLDILSQKDTDTTALNLAISPKTEGRQINLNL